MPINPNIALQYQSPQFQDPLEAYGRMMSIMNAKQTQQRNQMDLESMQRDLEAEVTVREILRNNPDIKSAMPMIMQKVGPRGARVATDLLNMKAAMSKMDEADLDLAGKKLTYLGNALYGIQHAPEEQKPAIYKQALSTLAQQGLLSQEQIGKTVPAEYPGDQIIDLFAKATMSTRDQVAAETARIRAESYANRVEDLARESQTKGQLKFGELELKAQELQRKIDRDTALDDRERQRLQNALDIARMNIQQRKDEEAGRQHRFEQGEEGKMDRLSLTQDRIDERQQIAIEKGFSPAQIAVGVTAALKAMGYASLEDLDDDNVEEFNDLVDSYLSRVEPKFGTKPGGFLNLGTEPTVTPGEEVNPRSRIHTSPPQSTSTTSHAQSGAQRNTWTLPPAPPGRVYILTPEGEPKTIPESQVDAYLRANPTARKLEPEK